MTFTRRALLATPLFVKAQSGIERTLHRASPAPGVAVWSFAYYTEAKGTRMKSIEQRISRSDRIEGSTAISVVPLPQVFDHPCVRLECSLDRR